MLEQIQIAMGKVSAPILRAGLLNNANILDTLNQYFENDQAYAFMNSIKCTPTYWEKFKSEVLAMVKQLDVPTFLNTLSSADLRWNELVEIIQILNKAIATLLLLQESSMQSRIIVCRIIKCLLLMDL